MTVVVVGALDTEVLEGLLVVGLVLVLVVVAVQTLVINKAFDFQFFLALLIVWSKNRTGENRTGEPRPSTRGPFRWAAANGGVTNGGLRGVWLPFLEISRNRPFSPFFCLFRPFPEGAKSAWEIQKTEEKGPFPQISSDLLKPPSLKPPFAALQFRGHLRGMFRGSFRGESSKAGLE